MKTVVDYLQANKKYIHDCQGRYFELILEGNQILLNYNDGWAVIKTDLEGYEVENVIAEILEDHKIEIRFCEECGKPFDAGFIAGDGDWYCCEECFDGAMNTTYGEGKWRPSDKEGEYGGWYENLDGDEWVDTAIYYTEWY
jgi:formylmethanofuran dehydrogenase subunit E